MGDTINQEREPYRRKDFWKKKENQFWKNGLVEYTPEGIKRLNNFVKSLDKPASI